MENRHTDSRPQSSILYPRSSILHPRSSISAAQTYEDTLIAFLLFSVSASLGQSKAQKWRPATEKELKSLIPGESRSGE